MSDVESFEAFWASLPAWRRGIIERAIERRERKAGRRAVDGARSGLGRAAARGRIDAIDAARIEWNTIWAGGAAPAHGRRVYTEGGA